MCIEIHVVDSDVAYYYQLTERDPYLQDNLVGDGTNTATLNNVCSRTLVSRTFITLLRDGSIPNGSLSKICPEDLLAKFGNVFIQHYGNENASTCSDTVFDACTNDTLINITYTDTCNNASTDKTLSDLGVYRCIYDIKDGLDTYLAIWNDDPDVANPFNCLAFRRTDDIIYATETPKFCSNTTTSSEAETGGVKLVIWDVITKPKEDPFSRHVVTTEAQSSLVGLYALLFFPFVVMIILATLFGKYWYRKYGCACIKTTI